MRSIILTIILHFALTSSVFAADVFLENENYKTGKPGFDQFVKLQTTENPDYNQYVNGRFAYSIYVPRELAIATYPMNRAGCGFKDGNGTSLTVFGMRNVLEETIDAAYDKALSQYNNAALATKGQNWYVISYLENGFIVYEKHFINAKYVNSLIFRYPKSLAEKYNPKCEVIESSFVPSWKTDYKIWG